MILLFLNQACGCVFLNIGSRELAPFGDYFRYERIHLLLDRKSVV